MTYFLVFLNLSQAFYLWESSKNIPPNLLVAAEVAVVLHLSSIEDLGGSREVFSTQPPRGGYHGTTVASKTGPIRRVRGMARLEITGCNHLAREKCWKQI